MILNDMTQGFEKCELPFHFLTASSYITYNDVVSIKVQSMAQIEPVFAVWHETASNDKAQVIISYLPNPSARAGYDTSQFF